MGTYRVSMAAARVNAGFTQYRLAEEMKVSKQTVVNWEAGISCPDIFNFLLFCEICGVQPDFIEFRSRRR